MADNNYGFDKVYLAQRQTAQVQGLDLTDCDEFNYFFIQQNKQGDVWVLPISNTLFFENYMKTIIVDVAPRQLQQDELDYRMSELESLVSTYGGVTIIKRIQKRDEPDYSTYIG